MRKVLRDNGLSIAMFALFGLFVAAQAVTGLATYNEDRQEHGEQPIFIGEYLTSGHFVESVFENWESEFLQMGAYVLLTTFLFQRGSSESKDPDAREPSDADPATHRHDKDAPGPVRAGGIVLKLYENSLFGAFLVLFLLSFVLHAIGGAEESSQEQVAHGGEPVTVVGYLGTSRFWFESFQNWQSEFLAVGAIVVLSIFLRQRGSPESKPVYAHHSATGQ